MTKMGQQIVDSYVSVPERVYLLLSLHLLQVHLSQQPSHLSEHKNLLRLFSLPLITPHSDIALLLCKHSLQRFPPYYNSFIFTFSNMKLLSGCPLVFILWHLSSRALQGWGSGVPAEPSSGFLHVGSEKANDLPMFEVYTGNTLFQCLLHYEVLSLIPVNIFPGSKLHCACCSTFKQQSALRKSLCIWRIV